MNWLYRKITIFCIILFVLLFIVLSIFVKFHPNSSIDIKIFYAFNKHQNSLVNQLALLTCWFGSLAGCIVIVGLTALFLFVSGYKKEAIFILLTTISPLISYLLKAFIHRPYIDTPPTGQVKMGMESFPSGHVFFYMVFFGFMIFLMRRLKTIPTIIRTVITIFSYFLILIVPVSAMYVGAHWFTDVVGGFLSGTIFLYLLCIIYLRVPDYYNIDSDVLRVNVKTL